MQHKTAFRRNFLIRALGFTAVDPTVSISPTDPQKRIDYHLQERKN